MTIRTVLTFLHFYYKITEPKACHLIRLLDNPFCIKYLCRFLLLNLVPSPTSPATSDSLFSGYSHRKTLWNSLAPRDLNASSLLQDRGD